VAFRFAIRKGARRVRVCSRIASGNPRPTGPFFGFRITLVYPSFQALRYPNTSANTLFLPFPVRRSLSLSINFPISITAGEARHGGETGLLTTCSSSTRRVLQRAVGAKASRVLRSAFAAAAAAGRSRKTLSRNHGLTFSTEDRITCAGL